MFSKKYNLHIKKFHLIFSEFISYIGLGFQGPIMSKKRPFFAVFKNNEEEKMDTKAIINNNNYRSINNYKQS